MERRTKLLMAAGCFVMTLLCLHYELAEFGAMLALGLLFSTQAILNKGN